MNAIFILLLQLWLLSQIGLHVGVLLLDNPRCQIIQRLRRWLKSTFVSLALLDRATVVTQASFRPLTQVSQKPLHCIDPGQILLEATYPPFLWDCFFFFLFKFSGLKFVRFFFQFRYHWALWERKVHYICNTYDSNLNMRVHRKVLECAISWKRLIVEWKRTKIWNSEYYVLHMKGTFHVWFLIL